jgi:arylformamidase
MRRIIDITLPLQDGMTYWPGTLPPSLEWVRTMASGDIVNASDYHGSVHNGTHVDAPLHHLANAPAVESLSLDVLIGPCQVIYLPDADEISAAHLERLPELERAERVLFRTRNSDLWAANMRHECPMDYVALTPDAAQWIVDHNIRLVGTDHLNIQRSMDSTETHKILLRAGVVVVEAVYLAGVEPATYELICLPVKMLGAEGAPARAILIA